ncbi:3'-5' exonuclease [Marinomonas fungiae]|uniref:DNA polymerase III, epsilon subunit or related 3'-5' exonuclease n=1 Tax=Marinomonas fungiae TaxID=1137284 RepID=A0A0K6ITE1_9GAMM|nr:exonuclease domain-containing protein [Marinomonas fungiae]CUB06344.1 DNA polymerase III, epsilon subunit or related 3'-5' exonuclease [Marinomonas fungiae]
MPKRIFQALDRWREHREIKTKPWQEHSYFVLDMETTGLDPKQSHVISLGWVLIENGAIQLDTAQHLLLDSAQIDDVSVGIHMITDSDVQEQGRRHASVLRYLRQIMKDKVLVVHYSPLELGFLKSLWQTQPMPALAFDWIDTMQLEMQRRARLQEVIGEGGYRLPACRERYGLPDYPGHDALTDAMATAELLLAQIAHFNGHEPSLQELVRMGGGRTRLSSNHKTQ